MPPDDEHPRYGHAALALGLLTALNLFNFIDRYVLPGVQPLVQHEFHASDERMGALTYAFFITYMLAAPLTGWLGDRVPRKPLVVAGALLWSVATLLDRHGAQLRPALFPPCHRGHWRSHFQRIRAGDDCGYVSRADTQ